MENKYFGECAEFEENEREEVKKYLECWKKFLLRKLKRDSYDVVLLNEQWGERPIECLEKRSMMYLKLYIKADWHYELGKEYK